LFFDAEHPILLVYLSHVD